MEAFGQFLFAHWLVILLTATTTAWLVRAFRRFVSHSFHVSNLLVPAVLGLVLLGHILIPSMNWKAHPTVAMDRQCGKRLVLWSSHLLSSLRLEAGRGQWR